jgi:hypothetical protein
MKQDTRLTNPIVCHPGGWGNDTPDWLRKAVLIDRLLEPDTGTNAEACAYLMSAAFTAPLDSDWAEIYFYVTTQTMERYGRSVPDDLRTSELSEYRMGMLRSLKRWIYEARKKGGKR